MAIICTKAGAPSCIRVPPERGSATSGNPCAVARRMAETIRDGGSHPDRTAQESELPGDHGRGNPTNPGISGQNGLIRP